MKTKYDIFISYRRTGGFESANLIAEKLRGMGYSVFFDVESLRSGKFNEQLYHVIEDTSCIHLSDWQTILLGLYGYIQVLPMFVASYVDDLDTLVNTARRVITTHAYRPFENQNAAQQQGIEDGAVIKPSVVYADLCDTLDDYVSLHPNSEPYITPLRLYYKMVAEGKRTIGGQLIFAFKDDAKHPIYKVGDIIVKRNDMAITDYESLSSAVSKDKEGTVEFLRMEGSKLVLHKENVPETSVLVGYMEVGDY